MISKPICKKIKEILLWILLFVLNCTCTYFAACIFIFGGISEPGFWSISLLFIYPIILWGIYTDIFGYLQKYIKIDKMEKFIMYFLPLLTSVAIYSSYFVIIVFRP